jgi:hypothetical protein
MMMGPTLLVALLLLASAAAAATPGGAEKPGDAAAVSAMAAETSAHPACGGHGLSVMTLEMMPEKAKSDGAVCLDGSPGGYYIQMAKNKTNNWQICALLRLRSCSPDCCCCCCCCGRPAAL